MKRIIIALLLLLPSSLLAENYRGLSVFAILNPKFPCDKAKRIIESSPSPGLAVLYRTFGNDKACLKSILDGLASKKHLLLIHLSNEPCRRNGRCKKTDFLPKLSVKAYNKRLERRDNTIIEAVRTEIRGLLLLSASVSNPNTELMVSMGLEDNFTPKAYEVLNSVFNEEYQSALVRSPLNRTIYPKFLELHGTHPKFENDPCIANLDGVSVRTERSDGYEPSINEGEAGDYLERHKNCKGTFLWTARSQGWTQSGKFIPPMKRNFVITKEDVKVLSRLLSRNIQ